MNTDVTKCMNCGRFIEEDDMTEAYGELEMKNGVTAVLTLCKFCDGGWIGDGLRRKMMIEEKEILNKYEEDCDGR